MATLGPDPSVSGGNTASGLGGGVAIGQQYTMPAGGGTVTSLDVRCNKNAGSPEMYPDIYADNGSNLPGARLGAGTDVVVPGGGMAPLNLPCSVSVPAGKFWAISVTDIGTTDIDYAASGGVEAQKYSFASSPGNDPFGTPDLTSSNRLYIIRVNYTPAASPPVNTVAPAVTGTAQENSTLTTDTGTFTGTDGAITKQNRFLSDNYGDSNGDPASGEWSVIPNTTGSALRPLKRKDTPALEGGNDREAYASASNAALAVRCFRGDPARSPRPCTRTASPPHPFDPRPGA